MKLFKLMLLSLILAFGSLLMPLAAEEGEILSEARTLLTAKKPKQAFQLLRESITDERMKQPSFRLALADAARLYAPEVPVLNGGERMRVGLFEGAGELYRQLIAEEAVETWQKSSAELGLSQLKLAMLTEMNESRERGLGEGSLRLAQAMSKLWPESEVGPMLIFEIGRALKKEELQLEGLRGAVATAPKEAGIYTLAAMLEQDEELGDGTEAALRHLNAGLEVLPGNLALLDSKARLLLRLGRLNEARESLALFEESMAKIPDDKQRATYLAAAASVYDLLGQTEEAQKRYIEVLTQQPDNLDIRFSLGSLYFSQAGEAMRDAAELPFEKGEERQALERRKDELLKLARVELEYAHKNGEPDLSVMRTLAEIYAQLRDFESSVMMQRDIKKVRNGTL